MKYCNRRNKYNDVSKSFRTGRLYISLDTVIELQIQIKLEEKSETLNIQANQTYSNH